MFFNSQVIGQVAGADDLDAIGKHQHAHRRADEVIAVNEGIGDQLLPDDAWNLGLPPGS